ncbi:biotin--[acetyl-CoA-carboxylase] ligase [soil metagenome]
MTKWGAEALWEQLEPLLPGLSIEVLPSCSSTNTVLLDRARGTAIETDAEGTVMVRRSVESAAFGRRQIDVLPCLLVAEEQIAGRGRQGRQWHAEPGSSLTFSLALPLAMSDWSGLSLAIGVALCEALAPAPSLPSANAPGALRLGLKWPNDLWLMDAPATRSPGTAATGRKLGGILIETVASGSARLAVIGIGLNVLPVDAQAASSGVASVQELDSDTPTSAPATLARIALPLVQALKLFEQQGFAAFAERFAALDVLRGQPVHTTQRDVAEGVACGVSPQGALLVRTNAGVQQVASGEVSVRPAGASVTAASAAAVSRPLPPRQAPS